MGPMHSHQSIFRWDPNFNSLQSHLFRFPHWYRTPSFNHSCPFCLKYSFTSWDISSPTFTVWSFPFSIQVITWLIAGSTFWAWTHSITVIRVGGYSRIRELTAVLWHRLPSGPQDLLWQPWRWLQLLLPWCSDPVGSWTMCLLSH